MAKPLRLEFSGAINHMTSRGNWRELIFESDDDRRAFSSVFDEVCKTFNWGCYARCLVSGVWCLVSGVWCLVSGGQLLPSFD
jgi:hypothetical protein